MFLDSKFNSSIESTILLSKPLINWFEINQETMAYFEFTHTGCLHFENSSFASDDVRILGRMANAALSYLEGNSTFTPKEKAAKATQAIAEIYESNKEMLSDTAKILYAINIDALEKDELIEKSTSKVLSRKNGIKNRRPGKGHRNH